jgi:outer membrane protein assembly factor BamA
MRSVFTLCAVVFLVSCAVADEPVLIITGNSPARTAAIMDAAGRVSCSSTDSACVDSMCHAIARYYWANGYLDARLRCRRRRLGADTVDVLVEEGRPSVLRSVDVTGASETYRVEVGRLFSEQIGKPLSGTAVERAISDALRFYDTSGYPLSRIRPEVVSSGNGWVGLNLVVDTGPRAEIGAVVFKGLEHTSPQALLSESGLAPGQRYDGSRVEAARSRLLSLGIFEQVSEAAIVFDSGDTTITAEFDVVEARTSRFEGLAAYVPSGDRSGFVGSLDLEFGNLGGSLRRLKISWRKPGSGRLDWSVFYREPRILSRLFALELKLASDVIDTSFARRRLWAGIKYRGEPRYELGVGASVGTTKDRNAAGGEGNFDELGFSFDFRYEGRDDPINPQTGLLLDFYQEVAKLDFEGDASQDRTLTAVNASGEYLAGIRGSLVAALGVRIDLASASDGRVPESHLIRLGGMRSLRGYAEEWFSVEKAAVASLELRRLLGRHSRIYVFFDGASIEDSNHSFGEFDSAPFGYGFGFVGGTRSGLVRLETALGRDDTWGDAKLHLGLVQRF